MINAELQHNPYLLETEVRFNGQSPKINCQIEKYEKRLLADWVKDVPGIFYDEMNGYDFNLYFSGTEYDFQKLKQAFEKKGVTSEEVRLIMRNELEDAEQKSKEIENLMEWFRTNKNRQFDFDSFYDTKKGLFEETFSCVVIRGMDEMSDGLTFSLENIKSVEEIAGTNLMYVPIVFVVEECTFQQVRSELLTLLERSDVKQNQLFFFIAPTMDKEYVVRFLCDLGLEEPQLLSSIDDGKLAEYIKNYPMVAHIREVIRIIENEVNAMDIRLKEKNEQSAIENADIYYQITALEEVIEKIKESEMNFADLDNYSGGIKFNDLRDELENLIKKWKSRKTKIVGENDIDKYAAEYERELLRWIDEFYRKAIEYCQSEKIRIEEEFYEIYQKQPLELDYKPIDTVLEVPEKIEITGLKDTLLTLKEIRFEEKTDIFNFFKAKALTEPKELESIVTVYCEKWREKVFDRIIPSIEIYIYDSQKRLQQYYDELAEEYHKKLKELHEYKVEEKNSIASQLSEDERKLQYDNDWLVEVKDQLERIERG